MFVATALITLFGTSLAAAASDVLAITSPHRVYPLGEFVEHFEDPGGQLTLAEIADPKRDSHFDSGRQSILQFGITRSHHWLRFRIKKALTPDTPLFIASEYWWDRLEFYVPSIDPHHPITVVGPRVARADYEQSFRSRLIPLPPSIPSGEPVYLRFFTESGAGGLAIAVGTSAAIKEAEQPFLTVAYVFCGLLLALFIYNGLLAIRLRDPAYGWYVLYVALWSFGATCVSGIASPLWQNLLDWGILFFHTPTCLAWSALVMFTTHFLQTKKHTPALHRALQICALAPIAIVCLGFLSIYWANTIALLIIPPVMICCVLVGGIRLWQGERRARFYCLAYGALFTGVSVYSLMIIRIFPINNLTIWAPATGTAFELLFLSFGLADSIAHDKRRKLEAELHASNVEAQAKENERRLSQEVALARTLVLGRQMNPHFLANQINDATHLIDEDPGRASEHLEELASFYRELITYCTKPTVAAKEERRILQQYLDINREEYRVYNISLEFLIDDEQPIPSMMIQPLIENAIKHGMSYKRDNYSIAARVWREDAAIFIEVSDNGIGLGGQKVESFFQSGHALYNVRQRLDLLYGAGASVTIRNRVPEGLVVVLKFPPGGHVGQE